MLEKEIEKILVQEVKKLGGRAYKESASFFGIMDLRKQAESWCRDMGCDVKEAKDED